LFTTFSNFFKRLILWTTFRFQIFYNSPTLNKAIEFELNINEFNSSEILGQNRIFDR